MTNNFPLSASLYSRPLQCFIEGRRGEESAVGKIEQKHLQNEFITKNLVIWIFILVAGKPIGVPDVKFHRIVTTVV